MSEETDQNSELTETKNDKHPVYHVVFMHSKFQQEYDDVYMMDLTHALEKRGHEVTIYTSGFNEDDYDIDCLRENVQIKFSGSWIPNSIFGLFGRTLERIKAIWMSLRLVLFPPKPVPKLVVLDIDAIALLILYFFGKHKTIYIHHFPELRASEFYHCSMHVTPDLITAKCINYANDIIVQTKGLFDVCRRTYPKLSVDPVILLPSYDTGLWLEDSIDVKRIIPDLPKDCVLFVAFGEYKKRTNFKLVLDALEHLFSFAENIIKQKIHVAIAGDYNDCSSSQNHHYYDLINKIKNKPYAAQITFLKQIPIIYQKTLIKECTALINPTRHDLYPGAILAAMSLSKPIITVNCGFAVDVMMHRLTGVLVEPDPYKFAKVMVKLALSKTLQHFLGDMSYSHFSAAYSFDRFTTKFNNLILKHLDPNYDPSK
ncbi:hypothetical protein ILUMI_19035 [Ignelater luminosus]|uniref:Alpha-1,3/1,6-mannosyltransferase ALG2 n=1 Tax=Ignelater luminosus TaxID=2038154 RepID=A0A8K0CGW8_IGNLU|nr:hypothetical protein ILUMI_19035 [Ignelater luminosus]